MSTNYTIRESGDDLDVPDFMRSDAPTVSLHKPHLTIVGEVVDRTSADTIEMVVDDQADDGEDTAPGIVEYYVPRPPVLYRGGSAAMTAARYTGRATALGTRYFGHGLLHTSRLGYRYVRARDHHDTIGGMASATDWTKIHQTRRTRWKFLARSIGGLGLADLLGWWGLTAGAGLAAADSWAILPGAEAAAAVAAITAYGRYRLNRRIAPGEIVAAEDIDDGVEPYPLAWCKSPEQVADCVGRALAAEGVSTRSIILGSVRDWGYEIDVVLKGSTPGKVQSAADQIESHLAIPDGGFMMEPLASDKSRITVRLVRADPFADMPRPQIHAPRSLSVHDAIVMGRAMDGSPFEITLDGFCALVVGAMGAGKTLGASRTIAEALTACVDAVCWDLDPIKGGLAEFGDLMELRARTQEECEEALDRALAYVNARKEVMPRVPGMGDRWKATAEHPHVYIFIDEYLLLTPKGKKTAIDVLRTGRQYGVYLIMMGQEATGDALGDAVAGVIPYRIGMACRFEDVRIVFGAGMGALGWRPDRMKPAVGPVVNDAGQSYIMGGQFTRPIRHRFNGYSRDQILNAVPERVAAGVNRTDADTILAAGYALESTAQRGSLTDQLAVSDEADAFLLSVLFQEFDSRGRDFLPSTEILVPAVEAAGIEGIDSTVLGKKLRSHADVKADRQNCPEGYLRGWTRDDVEKAAKGLLDPAKARQNPGKSPA
ncbi:hypothetical protein [Streptantibioticus silvisoli]|uniref:Cell division protein FtsK n=1 Tax=Streptantibioticus silvisoli TaxID=2705255 RepID=A0ABT6W5U6_9ACTN|nr:hypothetical protein [Streptantibioticus silvisoli]MDI5965755.1 hypothetical protein [Streptantibioticus silvisoli]